MLRLDLAHRRTNCADATERPDSPRRAERVTVASRRGERSRGTARHGQVRAETLSDRMGIVVSEAIARAGRRHDAGGGQHPAVRAAARRCVLRARRVARLVSARRCTRARRSAGSRSASRSRPPTTGVRPAASSPASPRRCTWAARSPRTRSSSPTRRDRRVCTARLTCLLRKAAGILTAAPELATQSRPFRRRCAGNIRFARGGAPTGSGILRGSVYDDAAAVLDSALRGDRDAVVGAFDAAVASGRRPRRLRRRLRARRDPGRRRRPRRLRRAGLSGHRAGPLRRPLGGPVRQRVRRTPTRRPERRCSVRRWPTGSCQSVW